MGIPLGGSVDCANPVIQGSFSGTGQSEVAAFYASFNASIWGTFVGSVTLQRSFDGGVTWLTASTDSSGTAATFTAPVSLTAFEPEHQVLYRWNCTAYTSGAINFRLSQSPDVLWIGGISR